jgi:methyl-accepting chemotaxis protein
MILQTLELRDSHTRAVLTDPTLTPEQAELVVARLRTFSDALLSSMGPPLLALGFFILFVPSLTAWMLARRQVRATAAVREAFEGLANGTPFAPRWASTDEIGDLAAGMVSVLERLQEIPTRLHASASLLLSAGTALGSASNQQRQSLTEQAAMLQQAQLTSGEIRTTSELASHKAESVLRVAAHAEQLGRYGESSIEQTLTGLGTIREFVDGIRGKVLRLQESATQIAHIAITVKDLADQSHLLALNASIEAARAGDQGAGFAVVASEIRKLADQSVRETALIRKSLLDIGTAIRDVVSMSEQGARQVEGGLEMVRSSGSNLREMSLIIQENAAAARQIATAVNQQNTGITHIFTAMAHLSTGMDETMKRLDTTLQATETLQAVTREVTEIARKYQFNNR